MVCVCVPVHASHHLCVYVCAPVHTSHNIAMCLLFISVMCIAVYANYGLSMCVHLYMVCVCAPFVSTTVCPSQAVCEWPAMQQGGDLTADQLLDYCFALLPSSLGSCDCFWALQCVVSSSHKSSLEVRLALEQRQFLSLDVGLESAVPSAFMCSECSVLHGYIWVWRYFVYDITDKVYLKIR